MLKLFTFAVVTTVVSVAMALHLWSIWADIRNFRYFIRGTEKKRAYTSLLYAVSESLIYLIVVVALSIIAKQFYN